MFTISIPYKTISPCMCVRVASGGVSYAMKGSGRGAEVDVHVEMEQRADITDKGGLRQGTRNMGDGMIDSLYGSSSMEMKPLSRIPGYLRSTASGPPGSPSLCPRA